MREDRCGYEGPSMDWAEERMFFGDGNGVGMLLGIKAGYKHQFYDICYGLFKENVFIRGQLYTDDSTD